jgi:SAM-dependent methyltransferase
VTEPSASVDNRAIYDSTWPEWLDMKLLGPSSRWLRDMIDDHLATIERTGRAPTSVLDVGSGEGTNTWMIAQRLPGARVLGIDLSSTGVECARDRWKLPNLAFEHDPESARLGARYDLVTCFETLEHVEDWRGLLDRIAAASDRHLMLSFPVGRMRAFEKSVGHLRNFRRGEVEAFLAERSFRPTSIFYAGFPFYSPLYRELCNLTSTGASGFTQGKYGASQRFVAGVLHALFRHGSTRRRFGDQFCGLFERTSAAR